MSEARDDDGNHDGRSPAYAALGGYPSAPNGPDRPWIIRLECRAASLAEAQAAGFAALAVNGVLTIEHERGGRRWRRDPHRGWEELR